MCSSSRTHTVYVFFLHTWKKLSLILYLNELILFVDFRPDFRLESKTLEPFYQTLHDFHILGEKNVLKFYGTTFCISWTITYQNDP